MEQKAQCLRHIAYSKGSYPCKQASRHKPEIQAAQLSQQREDLGGDLANSLAGEGQRQI